MGGAHRCQGGGDRLPNFYHFLTFERLGLNVTTTAIKRLSSFFLGGGKKRAPQIKKNTPIQRKSCRLRVWEKGPRLTLLWVPNG